MKCYAGSPESLPEIFCEAFIYNKVSDTIPTEGVIGRGWPKEFIKDQKSI